MKCPHCNYVSFDSIPRCKKCGFQFKPARSHQEPLDITSIVSDTTVKGGTTDVIHEDDGHGGGVLPEPLDLLQARQGQQGVDHAEIRVQHPAEGEQRGDGRGRPRQ